MWDNKSSSGSFLTYGVFIVFLAMKLTEKCLFWGNHFPRFLKSTDSWWDGWFMVFLPLWVGLPIALIVIIGFLYIKYLIKFNFNMEEN